MTKDYREILNWVKKNDKYRMEGKKNEKYNNFKNDQ